MAGEGPQVPDGSDRPHGQDRETEPMPRARAEADADAVTAETPVYVDPEPDVPDDEPVYDDEDLAEEFDDPAGPRFDDDEFARVRGDAPPPAFASRRVLPLEEEPSKLIARYLFPTEKFRGEWKRHWIQIAKELAGAAAATILMGYLTGKAAGSSHPSLVLWTIIVWGAAMVFFAWRIADWYVDRFILTNKRVMVVKGLITRNVGMMPLLRVTDMKYVQSPVGRLLGYGNFELESAGQDQALSKIRNLPNPNELYLRIVEEMYEPEAVEARLSRGAEEADGT
jgi:membrane protein YdbS with pleckstrin-like domain